MPAAPVTADTPAIVSTASIERTTPRIFPPQDCCRHCLGVACRSPTDDQIAADECPFQEPSVTANRRARHGVALSIRRGLATSVGKKLRRGYKRRGWLWPPREARSRPSTGPRAVQCAPP